jgi:hypothetical protein
MNKNDIYPYVAYFLAFLVPIQAFWRKGLQLTAENSRMAR